MFIRPTYGGEHGYGVFHRPDPEKATIMRDGVVWGNKDAYHFEKYDMELSPEFRAYAIAHAPKA